MEAVTPPIFLRFVNLLMNDAVFLLDEALSNMAQIRTMRAARLVYYPENYSFYIYQFSSLNFLGHKLAQGSFLCFQ